MPERVTLVGIEGRCFDRTRDYMTREVHDAIGAAVKAVEELVGRGQQ
jgi:hydrogenase maturation protease